LDYGHSAVVDLSPLFAALDAVLQVTYALLHIPIKHVLDIDLALAPLYYFIAYLLKQTLNPVFGTVVLALFPDHTHSVE
jgi:hypothetical protein